MSEIVPAVDLELLHLARDLALAAGQITVAHFHSDATNVDWKEDGTPVTIADRDAERFLRQEILRRFPDDAILGEEEGEQAGSTSRRWIIDPVDGTKAFTAHVPLYTTLLAMDDEYGPALGIINAPALGEIVWAGRGRGCFLNDRATRVRDHRTLQGAILSASGYDYWPEPMLFAARRSGMLMRTWGDGYGYLLVAAGRIDAMVDPIVAPWDMAPMPVIMSEAGGRFSSLDGDPGTDCGSGLGSNGHLHDELLELLHAHDVDEPQVSREPDMTLP